MLGPIGGLLFGALGMMKAFGDLSNDGISDPHALSGHIGLVLTGQFVGLAAFLVGLVLVIVCALLLVTGRQDLPPIPASRPE
jgi:hypothetical protein